MTIKVVFTEDVFKKLTDSLEWDGAERMAYVLCHSSTCGDDIKLIPGEVIVPDNKDYKSRFYGGFQVNPSFADMVVNYAIEEQCDLIQVHIHPGAGAVSFSGVDDRHEPLFMREVARQVNGIYHGSLVFSQDFADIDGWFYDRKNDAVVPIEKVMVVGPEELKLFIPWRSRFRKKSTEGVKRMDRTVKAFGHDAVDMLGKLDVGVVGASALGGPVLEMLARDGFGSIAICDNDCIDDSNLNRLPGAGVHDVGRKKVDFYKEYISGINPDVDVVAFDGSFYEKEVQAAFAQADIIMGCVDSGARFSINRLCIANCIPYFDMGAGIVREDGSVTFKGGHVVSIIPGRNVCLECSGMYKDLKKEFLPPEEIDKQIRRGYIDAEEGVRPLVSHLDYVVAGMGYHAMLSYVWGESEVGDFKLYCDLATCRMMKMDVSRKGCLFCQAEGLMGKGDKVSPLVPQEAIVEVPLEALEAG